VTFDETFDAMYEPLARYCYRLGGDRDVAEDIAQEAMVRFFERGIEGSEAGVRSWLFKTATHLVRDRYRVEENRKRLLQETPVTPLPPSTPEQSLEVNETRPGKKRVERLARARQRDVALEVLWIQLQGDRRRLGRRSHLSGHAALQG